MITWCIKNSRKLVREFIEVKEKLEKGKPCASENMALELTVEL